MIHLLHHLLHFWTVLHPAGSIRQTCHAVILNPDGSETFACR